MKLTKNLLIIFLIGLCRLAYGQAPEVVSLERPYFLTKVASLPSTIGSARCAVIFSVPPETGKYIFSGNWKKLVDEVHQSLVKMKIDAILYIEKDHFLSGPETHHSYLKILQERGIKNLIFVEQLTNEKGETMYSLQITSFGGGQEFIEHGQSGWSETSSELSRLFLRLGRQLLRQGVDRTNFLIPEIPEILSEPTLYSGLRLENFPGQLRRATLGVVRFQKISPPAQSDDEAVLQILEAYNQEVDKKNEELDTLLKNYPFRYELIDYSSEEELYRAGYQYILVSLFSSGEFIQRLLAYPLTGSETSFVSIIPDLATDNEKAKRIPARALVFKYYIKQTVSSDVHVGKAWDADTTWQQALTNFLLHLQDYMNR